MEFIRTKISDVILVKSEPIKDHRGYFMESYHYDKYKSGGINQNFVQDNQAESYKNTLRGLHFQIKYPQAKLVQCIKGNIFDVAVDLRLGSPTYGKWIGQELSEQNKFQLYIPEGFAHGYYVNSEIALISYKCSEVYYPKYDAGLFWNDSDISIKWPTNNPIISDKDKIAPKLNQLPNYFNYNN